MTAEIKPAAAPDKKEVHEPSRELNVDELASVVGGAPSAKPSAKLETYLTITLNNTMISG
jgi:hypothetical protein